VRFEEAATVFDDPLFIVQDASRNDEERNAVIGFSAAGRLLTVVHVEMEGGIYPHHLSLACHGSRGSTL
jgi:uncharacterized DUF497 family protein